MKYLIGCLALIGLVFVVLIGGCFGLIGYGIASLPPIPAYVTRAYVEQHYGPDLELIDHALRSGTESTLNTRLSSDIIAIYLGQQEVLKRHEISSRSYHTTNAIGIGTLRSNTRTFECIIYEMKLGTVECMVFIFDRNHLAK